MVAIDLKFEITPWLHMSLKVQTLYLLKRAISGTTH